ncbi:MAG: FAD-dependent oxidoreductase, partial [Chloroflexota bacterium]
MDAVADLLVVGAGHAGVAAATAFRQGGFQGSILMVTEEPELPYARPPLSKEYLCGERSFDRLGLRPGQYWTEARIDVRPGRRVTRVDPRARRVVVDDVGELGYGELIWAAGGTARRLACPNCELAGVHTVRSRADVDRIRSELHGASRIAVIGGGYIGLEVAAVLTKMGKAVTVLEALDRV